MPEASDLKQATLAILAGGEGRRMGRAKAELEVGGRPLLRYLMETVRWPGATLLVTAPGRERPRGAELFDREAVDPVGQGPLRGVLTALQNCETARLVVVPVDMPGVRCAQLEWMLDRLGPDRVGLMLRRIVGKRAEVEPFPFACTVGATDGIARQLAAGNFSVRSLGAVGGFAVEDAPVDWPGEVWLNLNTEEDYRAFVARVAGGM